MTTSLDFTLTLLILLHISAYGRFSEYPLPSNMPFVYNVMSYLLPFYYKGIVPFRLNQIVVETEQSLVHPKARRRKYSLAAGRLPIYACRRNALLVT
jgi:hypothetical protein